MRQRLLLITPGIILSTCFCFFLLRQLFSNDEVHIRHKRTADDLIVDEKEKAVAEEVALNATLLGFKGEFKLPPLHDESLPPEVEFDGEDLKPGNLICEQSPPTLPPYEPVPPYATQTIPGLPPSSLLTRDRIVGELKPQVVDPGKKKKDEPESEREENPLVKPPVEVPPHKLPIVTGWRDPKKNIGCCPPGEKRGTPYSEGMACCHDRVYNATSQFCCASKQMILPNTPEEILFCYPVDRIPFCREKDLGLSKFFPMTVKCRHRGGKRKTPTKCTFICPPGSQVRGQKQVACLRSGIWSEVNPICCEGCPSAFIQDFWFLVDINEIDGTPSLAAVRTFIRGLTSYFPISQTQVRVAVTAFNNKTLTEENSWFLDEHNSSKSLHEAVNNLPQTGTGRNTGGALQWLSGNAFTSDLGDRPGVENVVVLITTGPPDDDSFLANAQVLREQARFIIVLIGNDFPTTSFSNAVSPPTNQNFLSVPSYYELDRHHKYLYDLFCQENCLKNDRN